MSKKIHNLGWRLSKVGSSFITGIICLLFLAALVVGGVCGIVCIVNLFRKTFLEMDSSWWMTLIAAVVVMIITIIIFALLDKVENKIDNKILETSEPRNENSKVRKVIGKIKYILSFYIIYIGAIVIGGVLYVFLPDSKITIVYPIVAPIIVILIIWMDSKGIFEPKCPRCRSKNSMEYIGNEIVSEYKSSRSVPKEYHSIATGELRTAYISVPTKVISYKSTERCKVCGYEKHRYSTQTVDIK